mgnify:CR=1 FL=1
MTNAQLKTYVEEILRTPDKFIGYLQSKQPDEVVGQSAQCTRRSIANFIKTKTRLKTVVVFSEKISIQPKVRPYIIPANAWIKQFIEEIDGPAANDVSAAKCLEVLSDDLAEVATDD